MKGKKGDESESEGRGSVCVGGQGDGWAWEGVRQQGSHCEVAALTTAAAEQRHTPAGAPIINFSLTAKTANKSHQKQPQKPEDQPHVNGSDGTLAPEDTSPNLNMERKK